MAAAAEQMVDELQCSRCEGERVVFSQTLRRHIRCPQCTVREPRHDSAPLHALNGAEARRVAQASRMIRSAVAIALRGKKNPAWIADQKLRVVDRIMQRWAVGHGSGLPPEEEDRLQCRPPPLDDATQCVVDHIVNDAPPYTQKFVGQWYRTETPCTVMAEQRGLSPSSLYHEMWPAVLAWLRGKFLDSRHSDLIRMISEPGA